MDDLAFFLKCFFADPDCKLLMNKTSVVTVAMCVILLKIQMKFAKRSVVCDACRVVVVTVFNMVSVIYFMVLFISLHL